MQDGKKRVTVTLDAELLDRFDALCRERGQDRARAIEAMMRRSLKRQARSEQRAEQDPLDPNRMILHALSLQEVARKLTDGEFDKGRFRAHPVLLALATEIALKAWQCRERKGGDPDHRHDLVALFDGLSEDARNRLEARFQTHPDPFGAHAVDRPGDLVGMRQVLEAHRNTFEAWRYSYEHDALFAATPQLKEVLAAIIETYSPPRVVRLPGLGNMARCSRSYRRTRST